MSNLGQLFGQDKLRIMQLEDELAEGYRGRAGGISVSTTKKKVNGQPTGVLHPTTQRTVDTIRAARRPLSARELIDALGDIHGVNAEVGYFIKLKKMAARGTIVRSGEKTSYRYGLPEWGGK